ncbi:hypothetical protein ACM41_23210 [Bradyrhizobium sp. CCBAU 21362]|nr:hypothetical protein [Bradyrhizobium sp. CCBAU 21362]
MRSTAISQLTTRHQIAKHEGDEQRRQWGLPDHITQKGARPAGRLPLFQTLPHTRPNWTLEAISCLLAGACVVVLQFLLGP